MDEYHIFLLFKGNKKYLKTREKCFILKQCYFPYLSAPCLTISPVFPLRVDLQIQPVFSPSFAASYNASVYSLFPSQIQGYPLKLCVDCVNTIQVCNSGSLQAVKFYYFNLILRHFIHSVHTRYSLYSFHSLHFIHCVPFIHSTIFMMNIVQ